MAPGHNELSVASRWAVGTDNYPAAILPCKLMSSFFCEIYPILYDFQGLNKNSSHCHENANIMDCQHVTQLPCQVLHTFFRRNWFQKRSMHAESRNSKVCLISFPE